MSKEAKETKAQGLNVENIEESIRNGSVITEEIAKKAAEDIAKRRNEELTQKLIRVTQKAEYTRKRILLSAKKTKKDGDVKMGYLKKYSELHDKLTSGDKSLSLEEFEKKVQEEKNTATKMLRENETWYSDQRKALDDQYPGSWSWSFGDQLI